MSSFQHLMQTWASVEFHTKSIYVTLTLNKLFSNLDNKAQIPRQNIVLTPLVALIKYF